MPYDADVALLLLVLLALLSTPGPAYDVSMRAPKYEAPALRFISWNVAGMRALLKKDVEALRRLVEQEQVDAVCLQVWGVGRGGEEERGPEGGGREENRGGEEGGPGGGRREGGPEGGWRGAQGGGGKGFGATRVKG